MNEAELLAAWSSAATAAFAIAAIVVTALIAIHDRRAADRRAIEDRAEARREASKRWEAELLVRLAVALESGGNNPEGSALVMALGPSRLPAACYLLLGPPEERTDAIAGRMEGLSEWNAARSEVARALQDGLPATSPERTEVT